MATTAGFKVQCPSCEAMVSVKDSSFVGRKIDCPKCKYRFVVENPEGEPEDDVEEEVAESKPVKKKAGPVTAKKPANGKVAPGKKKPGRLDDDDDGKKAKKKQKASGGSTLLIVGLGLGGVGLIVLVVVGILLFSGGGSNNGGTKGGGGGGGNAGPINPPKQLVDDKDTKNKDDQKAALGALFDATNLLPNETEEVSNINVAKLLESSVGKAAFQTTGGFSLPNFEKKMGFPLGDLTRIVQAGSITQGWKFTVMQSNKPFNKDVLTTNLALQKDARSPIENLEFFTVNTDLESLGAVLFQTPLHSKPLLLNFYDDRTVVLAHEMPMQKFLEAKGKPKQLTDPAAPSASGDQANNPGGNAPGGGKGGGGMQAPGLSPGGSGMQPGGMQPGGGGKGGGGMQPPGMSPGGMQPGGMQPGGAGPEGGTEQPAATSYLTIKPALKNLLDKLEEGKQPIISAAADINADPSQIIKQLEQNPLAGDMRQIQAGLGEVTAFGIALYSFKSDKLAGMIGVDCKSEESARNAEKIARLVVPLVIPAIAKELTIKIAMGEQNNTPGGMQYPGGSQPPPGSSPDISPPRGGGALSPPAGASAGPGGGSSGPPRGGQPGPGMMPPGAMNPGGMNPGGMYPGGNQPGGSSPGGSQENASSHVTVTLREKSVLLAFDLTLNDSAYQKIFGIVSMGFVQARGRSDMASGKSHTQELAAALKAYVLQNKQFPRGTADRESPQERGNLPTFPDQRVSWMAELLPFLGQGEYASLYRQIKTKDKSWREDDNLTAAQTLIPAFLAADYPDTTWWGLFPGVNAPVANTHFVGIAGIGMDAAEFQAGDPSVAKKLGVFGYDRITRADDVKDGLANTIVAIQVPATFKSPWLAGGGSTIRGVPEKDSIKPFVCATYNGKRGTFAIMGDGKVRFLAETTPDADFQALCTIAGGEEVDVKAVAPEVVGDSAGAVKAAVPVVPGLETKPADGKKDQ